MHLFYLDAYFHLASKGDKEALNTLYQMFLESAQIEMYTAKKNSSKLLGIPEDFSIFLDDLFFSILNDYDPDRGSFRWYVSYVLEKKFSPKVKQSVVELQRNCVIRDEYPTEVIFGIDDVPDPGQLELSSDLALDNFKCMIASPLKHQTKIERLQSKILLLQYAGYSKKEICDELNITRGILRYQLEQIRDGHTMINLKLDLK